MDKNSMKKVIEAFKERDNFLITAHVNPEGDSVGSQLAAYHVLRELGKKAVMVDRDEVPDNLKFLAGAGDFRYEIPEGFRADAVVILDCPVRERTGGVLESLDGSEFIINIDHHVSNEFFADLNWVESDASSVGEMMFHLIREMGMKPDKGLATAIYTAIVTDTGMFNYSNTSRETHDVAGELIESGAEPKKVHAEIFESKSLPEVRLLGKALTTLQVEAGGRLAHMCLTRQMCSEEGVGSVPTDEFIKYPRSIKGVKVAVFFKDIGDARGKVNVSFRSSGEVNVNAVASRFGGGGHASASGCVFDGTLEQAREKILGEIKKVLDDG